MAIVMTWRIRNDVWLDNGLELFGQIAEHIAGQFPEVLQVDWQPEELRLTIHDVNRFVELLDKRIEEKIQITIFYTSKRQDEHRQVIKPFVGFNLQLPKQHPPIFQSDRRKEFLKTLFTEQTGSIREPKGCPLCGEVIERNEQKLTLSVYPFVTKIKSLSGIRTKWQGEGLRGFDEYLQTCPRCYFLGALVWTDDALLYLCDIGDGTAVILLPSPTAGNLLKLKRMKFYRPKHGERKTNVKFRRRSKKERKVFGEEGKVSEEEEEVREGHYSLLLAFLERTLSEIAEEKITDLFAEAQKRIPDGWLFVTIPQGKMKNITAHDLVLDEPIMKLLVRLVEQNKLPYAYMITEIWLAGERGRRLKDETSSLHESLAKAILTDDFEKFAKAFVPKPRRQLRFPFAVENEVETLVQLWRWSNVNSETLEVVKKSGRALAAIAASRKQPVLLYQLERVRSPSDLLEVLKEGIHRLIGLEADEMRFISLDALEQLTELLHQTSDARQFADLKNTLIIFAGIAYAKNVMAESRQKQGGEQ